MSCQMCVVFVRAGWVKSVKASLFRFGVGIADREASCWRSGLTGSVCRVGRRRGVGGPPCPLDAEPPLSAEPRLLRHDLFDLMLLLGVILLATGDVRLPGGRRGDGDCARVRILCS